MLSLLDLPLEVLSLVVQNLRPEFVGRKSHEWAVTNLEDTFNEQELGSIRGLAGLARSCKKLCQIVQPLMFDSPMCRSAMPLLRTMLERPDLAERVNELVIDWWEVPLGDVLKEDVDALECKMMDVFRDPFENAEQEAEDAPGGRMLRRMGQPDHFDDHITPYVAGLIVASAPNLQRISIRSLRWGFPNFAQQSLPHLEELEVTHSDSQGGISLSYLQELMDAAPALRVLKAHMVNDAMGIRHDNITCLDFSYSSIETDDFFSLMEGLPKLERLIYASGGPMVSDEREATPYQISHAVMLRRDTLKHLAVDFTYDLFMMEGEDRHLDSLSGMLNLQSLRVHDTIINLHPRYDGPQFPASLQDLGIIVVAKNDDHEEAWVDFSTSTVGSLPGLIEFGITGLSEANCGRVEAACKAKDVSFMTNIIRGIPY